MIDSSMGEAGGMSSCSVTASVTVSVTVTATVTGLPNRSSNRSHNGSIKGLSNCSKTVSKSCISGVSGSSSSFVIAAFAWFGFSRGLCLR